MMRKGGVTYTADIRLKPTKAIHQQLQGPLKNHGRAVSAFSRCRRNHHRALTSRVWPDFQSQFCFYQKPVSYIYIFNSILI